jgi:hypothetical protein
VVEEDAASSDVPDPEQPVRARLARRAADRDIRQPNNLSRTALIAPRRAGRMTAEPIDTGN